MRSMSASRGMDVTYAIGMRRAGAFVGLALNRSKYATHPSGQVTVDIWKLVPGANPAAVDRLDAVQAMRIAQPSAPPAQPESRDRESVGRAGA